MVGLLLVLMGLTGSLLVFDRELDRFFSPALLHVTPQSERVPLETALVAVREAFPGEKPYIFRMPWELDGVYDVWMNESIGQAHVYVNPYSGELLGSRVWRHSIIGFMYELHVYLFAGKIGAIVVGIGGLLLLLLSVTGLILWPGWRRLVSGLKIRWRSPWRLLNYDLHKVGGIVSVVFLVVIASTGAGLVFWDQSAQALYWLTQTSQHVHVEPTSTLLNNKAPLALDELLPRADAALPGGKTIDIYLPKTPQASVIVRKKLPQEVDPYGASFVYLDQYTGELLRIENALKAPLADRIMNSLYPLHIGVFGGISKRVFYVFVGLTLPILFITGFALWWSRTYGLWGTKRRGV